MLRAAALWIVFLGLYLLFAAPVSTQELIAGVPSAAAVTGFALLYRRAEERRMDIRTPWLRVMLRALGTLPPDALRVGGRAAAVALGAALCAGGARSAAAVSARQ